MKRKNEKYLVDISFKYNCAPNAIPKISYNHKTITVGIFNNIEDAYKAGNKALKKLEKRFPINPIYKDKRYIKQNTFNKDGGSMGHPRHMVTEIGYLNTPFKFFAEVKQLTFDDVDETLDEILESINEYEKQEKQTEQ